MLEKITGIIGSFFKLGFDGPALKANSATAIAARDNDDAVNVDFVAADLSSDTTHANGDFVEHFDGEATQLRTISATTQLLLTDREIFLDTSGIIVTMPETTDKILIIYISNRAGGKVTLAGDTTDTVDEPTIRNGETFRMRFDGVSNWDVT